MSYEEWVQLNPASYLLTPISYMDHFIILPVAFLAAALALFSGFGLGTILTPVFLVFYDAKTAIFLVAIVHLLNNLLKLGLFYKHIDIGILKRFGLAALAGSFAGAFSQMYFVNPFLTKVIALLLIYLGLQVWLPQLAQLKFPKKFDPLGGFLSGFLGGLVGNQGAVRSAYLLNYQIPKEVFIATGVVIACMIDVVRIPLYWFGRTFQTSYSGLTTLIAVTFLGTLVGKELMKHFSPEHFKKFVATVIMIGGIYFLIF